MVLICYGSEPRTSVNPFTVQEISDALTGVDVMVLVKNPINPDIELWIGAIERIARAGITTDSEQYTGVSHHMKKHCTGISPTGSYLLNFAEEFLNCL